MTPNCVAWESAGASDRGHDSMVRIANLPMLLIRAALKFSASRPDVCSQNIFVRYRSVFVPFRAHHSPRIRGQLRTLVAATGGHVNPTFTYQALPVNSPTRSHFRPVDMPTVAGVCSQRIETPAGWLGFGSQRLADTGWAFATCVEGDSPDYDKRTGNG